MSPFDITQWTDYARDLVEEETRTQMEAQLESDEKARRTVAALERVAEVARQDRAQQVPDGILRSVYALSSQPRPERESAGESFFEGLRRAVMSLTFDSAMAPALAGVRDAQSLHRQLFFELDDVAVELRHEPHERGDVVVGQLIRLGDEAEPLANVQVLAKSDERVLARLATGPHGEFQMDQLPAQNVSFSFLLETLCLEVPLPKNDR